MKKNIEYQTWVKKIKWHFTEGIAEGNSYEKIVGQ